MNPRSSSWTQRAPRTLEQAFGPHSSGPVHPMPDRRPIPRHEIALYIVSAACAIVVGLLLLTGR